MMWVTTTGGLFYYSHRHGKPLGGAIVGLKVSIDTVAPRDDYYEFNVATAEEGIIGAVPTIFATRTEKERELWVKHLVKIHDEEEREGGHQLDPLDGFQRLVSTDHRGKRLATFTASTMTSAAMAAVLAADAPLQGRRREKRMTTHGGFDRLTTFGIDSAPQEMTKHRTDLHHEEDLPLAPRGGTRIQSNNFHDGIQASLQASLHRRGLQAFSESSGEDRDSEREQGCTPTGSRKPSITKAPDLASPRMNPPEIRRDSRKTFNQKDQTMLVLDWDDTIFPTTFVRKDCGLDWRRSIAEQVLPGPGRTELEALFVRLTNCMENFITSSCSMATVCIVTLAKHPWVLTSCDNFLPAFRPLMEKYNIKIIYARDCMTEDMRREYGANTFKTSDQEADFWMRAKQAAMEREITEMYTSSGSSWKNIISIGDSDFERVALLATAESHVSTASASAQVIESGLTSEFVTKAGHIQRLRAKTVKMLEDPSLEELIAQQTLLTSWLPHLINRDFGLDITFQNSEDDEQLNEMNRFVTGEDAELSWLSLAGVDPTDSVPLGN